MLWASMIDFFLLLYHSYWDYCKEQILMASGQPVIIYQFFIDLGSSHVFKLNPLMFIYVSLHESIAVRSETLRLIFLNAEGAVNLPFTVNLHGDKC